MAPDIVGEHPQREQPGAPGYLPDPAQAVVPGAQHTLLLEALLLGAFHAHSVARDPLQPRANSFRSG